MEYAVFTFDFDIVVVRTQFRREHFLKHVGSYQERHVVGTGFYDVGDEAPGRRFVGQALE